MKTIDLKCADNIRAISAAMVEKAKSGHPGGPMGGADFLHILYKEFLTFDPENTHWMWRDRFFLDPGHLSALLYAQLYMFNYYSRQDIENFRQLGSVTPGHPEVDFDRGVENTSGPLGQGHAMGIGAALAGKFLEAKFGQWSSHTIYAYISDGGIQEEISQGVGRIAGYLGLSNLVMFFDSNDVQLSTYTNEVTSENTAKKYEAWGWKVVNIDGHDHDAIRAALTEAKGEKEKPTLIIGKTKIGKGCIDKDGNSFEGYTELHGKPLGNTGADYAATMKNLGADPNNPFEIYSEVKKHYHEIIEHKLKEVGKRKEEENKWRNENPKDAEKLDLFMSGKMPDIDFSKIIHKANIASRDASSMVLAHLADHVENLIVSSADLANSDKTDGFLKKKKQFAPGVFDANFLHAGVSEFSMAAMANGMALHGGVIPVVGTFFIFSDYQKPALRLSALMEQRVIYLWTHDSFRVGEDGPTHQPIEQEVQIRLLESVKNHSGNNSFLVLRPADAAETSVAWEMILNNRQGPSGIILSRQSIKDLPHVEHRYTEALGARKGAYHVKKHPNNKLTLLASGSEVATLIEAAELLDKVGLYSNVVSIISDGLFQNQSEEYQKEIIGDKPVICLTAGLSLTLNKYTYNRGYAIELNHFGYSAPAGILDEEFEFTGFQVYRKVRAQMEEKLGFKM